MKRLVDFLLGAVVAAILLGPVAWADVRGGAPVPGSEAVHDGIAQVKAVPDTLGTVVKLVRHLF